MMRGKHRGYGDVVVRCGVVCLEPSCKNYSGGAGFWTPVFGLYFVPMCLGPPFPGGLRKYGLW